MTLEEKEEYSKELSDRLEKLHEYSARLYKEDAYRLKVSCGIVIAVTILFVSMVIHQYFF